MIDNGLVNLLIPLALCLAADFTKMGNYDKKKRAFYSGVDAGYVSQNIYLYCASEGLATAACSLIGRKKLYRLLKLADAKAMVSHLVGREGELISHYSDPM